MDFESIGELRAGNDPRWTFDFWTAGGEPFAVPFIVRYEDTDGNPLAAHGTMEFDGQKVLLIPSAA